MGIDTHWHPENSWWNDAQKWHVWFLLNDWFIGLFPQYLFSTNLTNNSTSFTNFMVSGFTTSQQSLVSNGRETWLRSILAWWWWVEEPPEVSIPCPTAGLLNILTYTENTYRYHNGYHILGIHRVYDVYIYTWLIYIEYIYIWFMILIDQHTSIYIHTMWEEHLRTWFITSKIIQAWIEKSEVGFLSFLSLCYDRPRFIEVCLVDVPSMFHESFICDFGVLKVPTFVDL